ncbi:MAG: hypothetical protein O2866_05415 [archaeon]|nr:hypothetical protein [archaeon]MDA0842811.1 hypothetical protein [archaeon]MDA1168304.1 hypothetical protein [archaeon]
MNEWNNIEILETEEDDVLLVNNVHDQAIERRLAEQFHSDFIQNSPHLSEVRSRHQQVLVASGMLPESHLAEEHPELALQWIVEELNGKLVTDGLELPMHGMSIHDIKVESIQLESGQQLGRIRLDIDQGGFQRQFPIPHQGIKRVTFIDGRLKLRW